MHRPAAFLFAVWAISSIAWAPPGTTVQLPTFGVSIDADGLLSVRVAADPTGQLQTQRNAAARAALPGDIAAKAPLRKVSLVRLERAIQAQLEAGQPVSDAMRNLAGLQGVEYIFCFPESGDIVLAGPAEGWVADATGRTVGLTTGRPVLLLEDLAVALRAFPPGEKPEPFIGCTIEPTAEGLGRLVEFQQTIPRTIPQSQRRNVQLAVGRGLRDSLGQARIRTFGVSPRTHLAQVMIEADYRMKLKAIGLEPPPIKLATYLDLVRTPKQSMLQRWWFTPNYECVRASDDRLAAQFVGQGVELRTENKRIGAQGGLQNAPEPDVAAERFAAGFTAKYPQLAAASPVYAQLRNVVDLLVAAAWLERSDYYGRIGWRAELLRDESRLATETLPAPQQVQAAVNCIWRGSRLLAPAGGGVEIHPHLALTPDKLLQDEDGAVAKTRGMATPAGNVEAWWWD